MLNQARLRVLKVREDHVRNVLDEARKRLSEISQDVPQYKEIMKLLVLQGLCQLTEAHITIRVRQVDLSLVDSIIEPIQDAYKQITKKDVAIKIDQDNFLSPDSCGGVDLYAAKGRIKVSNTLETRLELIAQKLIPEIRSALFGSNPNRKFTD